MTFGISRVRVERDSHRGGMLHPDGGSLLLRGDACCHRASAGGLRASEEAWWLLFLLGFLRGLCYLALGVFEGDALRGSII